MYLIPYFILMNAPVPALSIKQESVSSLYVQSPHSIPRNRNTMNREYIDNKCFSWIQAPSNDDKPQSARGFSNYPPDNMSLMLPASPGTIYHHVSAQGRVTW